MHTQRTCVVGSRELPCLAAIPQVKQPHYSVLPS